MTAPQLEGATPRPWEFYERPGYTHGHIKAGEEVLLFTGRNEDCLLVVAAVNDYDRLRRIETAAAILLSSVKNVMPEVSPYRCPHTRDWLLGLLDDVQEALAAAAPSRPVERAEPE